MLSLKILSYLFKGVIKGEYKHAYRLSKTVADHVIITNYDVKQQLWYQMKRQIK